MLIMLFSNAILDNSSALFNAITAIFDDGNALFDALNALFDTWNALFDASNSFYHQYQISEIIWNAQIML